MKLVCKGIVTYTLKLDYLFKSLTESLYNLYEDRDIEVVLTNFYKERLEQYLDICIIEEIDRREEDEDLLFLYVVSIKYINNILLKFSKVYSSVGMSEESISIVNFLKDLNKEVDNVTSSIMHIDKKYDNKILILFNEYIKSNGLTDGNFNLSTLEDFLKDIEK